MVSKDSPDSSGELSNRREFAEAVRGVLEYHHVLGIAEYPFDGSVQNFLESFQDSGSGDGDGIKQLTPGTGTAPAQKAPPGHTVRYGKRESGVRRVGSTARERSSAESSRREVSVERTRLLGAITEEVKNCTACDLHEKRRIAVPGSGSCQVRMMLVGDWLNVDRGGKESVFGLEEDLMLGRMITAMKLKREEVFVTNVIKCGIPESLQPRAHHVQICASYLRRQISCVRPESICAMGSVAAKALLENAVSLSRMRGRFHSYVEDSGKIPVVCTYHPGYLLRNPEMKQATWEDLKMLARRLGTLR